MTESQSSRLAFNPENIFKAKSCVKLALAWDSWRGDKLVPNRADIDLPSIKKLLSQISLMDFLSKEEIIIRVVGTDAREVTGSEITGQNWIELTPEKDRKSRGERLWQLGETPCAAMAIGSWRAPTGQNIHTEFAVFPIIAANEKIPFQAIVCFSPLTDYIPPIIQEGPKEFVGVNMIEFTHLDIGAGIPKPTPWNQN